MAYNKIKVHKIIWIDNALSVRIVYFGFEKWERL